MCIAYGLGAGTITFLTFIIVIMVAVLNRKHKK